MRSDDGYFVTPNFGVLRAINSQVSCPLGIVEVLQCGHVITHTHRGFLDVVGKRRCGACAAQHFIALVRAGVDLRA